MKTLFSILVGIAVFLIMIFVVDKAIVNAIAEQIPKSAAEYLGLIRIGLWIIILFLTTGLSIWIGMFFGFITRLFLGE